MNSKSLALCLMLAIAGCAQTPTSNIALTDTLTPRLANIEHTLTADDELYSMANFNLALALLQRPETDHEKLLVYLRAYSYFGDMKVIDAKQASRLAEILAQIAQAAPDSSREQIAVVGYRFFADKDRGAEIAPFTELLASQLKQLAAQPASLERDYALWETLRAYGFLLFESRKHPDSSLAKTMLASDASTVLLNFAGSDAAISGADDWPRMNAYWALALYRLALPAGDDGEATPAERKLDEEVKNIAAADAKSRGEAAKTAYTLGYHVNRFAGKEACEQDALCVIPELTQVLPQRHECSDSLYILSQDLTEAEFAESCTRLISQEDSFHALLQTARVATANDFNQALQVVAFKNWSQYNAYGQLLFDIGTDNGGMYIEGTPSKPGNQASFFAFRQWWIAPEFAIWNLNHEYVHYLDGRFVKYGGFGHFPGKMVWWAEGLAEYVSKSNDNPDAIKLAREKRAEAPTLADIFATEYKDGLDRTYRWSYLAIRYLAEQRPAALVELSRLLKTDYFEGYDALLSQVASEEQSGFETWLDGQIAQAEAQPKDAPTLPRKLNRYAYRDYLTPAHLQLPKDKTGVHFHF
ncbi:collagenase [Shewanella khirikhana]|uniref:Microbial collagenase n=1 Tax=Shewanella khirikhana TaxID=1965282 RepID=A0ABM7DSR7_9GAMM|nr:collagenase [Shewanella khirikhana]AZQ12754.1 Microbial collagenase precursor [Shewanella khirikhana]